LAILYHFVILRLRTAGICE